jgi:hypothetical protein
MIHSAKLRKGHFGVSKNEKGRVVLIRYHEKEFLKTSVPNPNGITL